MIKKKIVPEKVFLWNTWRAVEGIFKTASNSFCFTINLDHLRDPKPVAIVYSQISDIQSLLNAIAMPQNIFAGLLYHVKSTENLRYFDNFREYKEVLIEFMIHWETSWTYSIPSYTRNMLWDFRDKWVSLAHFRPMFLFYTPWKV